MGSPLGWGEGVVMRLSIVAFEDVQSTPPPRDTVSVVADGRLPRRNAVSGGVERDSEAIFRRGSVTTASARRIAIADFHGRTEGPFRRINQPVRLAGGKRIDGKFFPGSDHDPACVGFDPGDEKRFSHGHAEPFPLSDGKTLVIRRGCRRLLPSVVMIWPEVSKSPVRALTNDAWSWSGTKQSLLAVRFIRDGQPGLLGQTADIRLGEFTDTERAAVRAAAVRFRRGRMTGPCPGPCPAEATSIRPAPHKSARSGRWRHNPPPHRRRIRRACRTSTTCCRQCTGWASWRRRIRGRNTR